MNYKEPFVSLIGFALILKSLSLSLKYNNLRKKQPKHFPQVERNQLDNCKAQILGSPSALYTSPTAKPGQVTVVLACFCFILVQRFPGWQRRKSSAIVPFHCRILIWGGNGGVGLGHLDGRHIVRLSNCARVGGERLLGREVFQWGRVKNNNRVPAGPGKATLIIFTILSDEILCAWCY